MPQTIIDYSNTIIYKITCKDLAINETYVGHTTNFVQRKHSHKQSCTNEKSMNYNCKLYKTIRANGGWDNWEMNIITFFKCNHQYEARIKEQEYFILLNATLNSIEPFPKPKMKEPKIDKQVLDKIFFCVTCNVRLQNEKLLELHNKTNKHFKKIKINQTEDATTLKTTKNENIYNCIYCDFNTCKKTDFKRHNLTQKHKTNVLTTFDNDKKEKNYLCEICEKSYNDRAGLWRHKKKCVNINSDIETTTDTNSKNQGSDKDDLINYLMKENQEFKNLILEIVKKDK